MGLHLRKRFKYKRKKGPLPFRHVLLLSFIFFTILTLKGIWIVDYHIRPSLLLIANMETQKIATSTINYAMRSTVEDIDTNDLISIEKDEYGNITSVGFDANIYSEVVSKTVANAQHYLKKMEEGKLHELGISLAGVKKYDKDNPNDIIYHIPLGMVTKNAFLANLGPKIPVKFTAIGDVDVDIKETIKNVGINNTWIDLSLDLEVHAKVIIPFATDTDKVRTTIPVGMIFIPGTVPDFFSSNAADMPRAAIIR